MQPHIDRLMTLLQGSLQLSYVMGGLLPSWDNFYDTDNAVSRPAQMGPVWMHAGQVTGRPLHPHLWISDPPASSYPACVAVKVMELQCPALVPSFFRQLQQAALGDGKNIAKGAVIEEVAEITGRTFPGFDHEQFVLGLRNGQGVEAFRQDLALVRHHSISRFPTLLMTAAGYKGIRLSGYRHFDVLLPIILKEYPFVTVIEQSNE